MANKQGKMQNLINYRMRVTLNDGRQMTGQMLAFDKVRSSPLHPLLTFSQYTNPPSPFHSLLTLSAYTNTLPPSST